jgi:penicillin-binding protein 1A
MKKTLKILFRFTILLALVVSGSLVFLYIHVALQANARIERGAIDRIIFSESPVYYDDQTTPIGVYFEKIHSKYIRYQDIPKIYVKALIASEDRNFFSHPGFDIKAILRAFIANCKAGGIVQGGSTITQQTAKNIFRREKRTYLSKLKELMQALLLEKKYSKEDILEMYINQFFVTGFGKGLTIAAEYFFDKDAENLDLVESAFIAGMVKGPDRYNPFTKKSDEEKEEAMRLAKMRKDYVLKNMKELDLITKKQYLEARDREVPFREGKVTYRLNVILDYIREQLESEYFKEILYNQGVDNIATSGIKIYTSVSKEIQEGALNTIRRELPILDIELTGYNKDQFQERYIEGMGTLYENPDAGFPFFCTITAINHKDNNPSLVVAWDGGEGIIGYEGLKPMGEAWLKWKIGRKAVFERRHLSDFIKNFDEGDVIPVHFVEEKGKNAESQLTLWQIPELEGGIIVLRNGMIKAMVGGFFDRYFNRAADAKRQVGSIFKPIVYTAALQLEWNNLDQLHNVPDLFRFENTLYIPRPDHEPKSDKVSMMWAGAKSENLATVWLLYHLTDRLNISQFRDVVERLGLARKETETYSAYVKRIRDVHGVVVNKDALMAAAFEQAKKEIESDLIFSGYEDCIESISRLHFEIDVEELDLTNQGDSEITRFDFKRVRSLNYDMKKRFNESIQLLGNESKTDRLRHDDLKRPLTYFYYGIGDHNSGEKRIIYSEAIDKDHLEGAEPITLEWLLDRNADISLERVWIDNMFPSQIIDLIQKTTTEKYKELLAFNRYDFETLYMIRDFRTLVNLFYVKQLSKEMGISTQLDPVLSFPLGANSISILEASLAYNTIISGRFFPVDKGTSTTMNAPIITRITDRNGETIWEYVASPEKVLSRRVSGSVTEILRMVTEQGTGRKATGAVELSVNSDGNTFDIPVPVFGKTGTANLFRNSSFVGIIPGLDPDTGRFDMEQGYVIASYVGYDDNRPMKGRNINISGASGALPLWIDTANVTVNSREYKEGLRLADLAFILPSDPRVVDNSMNPVKVSGITGLPPLTGEEDFPSENVEVFSHVETEGAFLVFKRDFEPVKGVYDEGDN